MCLYPKLIRNPKYKPNKKNNGNVPIMNDERVAYVPIGCGRCIECLKQKGREWRVRLNEEIRNDNNVKFVTFTFSPEAIEELNKLVEEYARGYVRENRIVTIAIRRFLERWRKKYKKSVKHWFITEKGNEGTKRIHVHGFLWTDKTKEEVEDRWQYGIVDVDDRGVTERTINYIIKYLMKQDAENKDYLPIILTSAGIGKGYLKRADSKRNRYRGIDTNEMYKSRNGQETNIPMYYRNKIYSEEEREKLWLHKLDKEERYVLGQKIDISTEEGERAYENILKDAQMKNRRLGYNDDRIDWKKKEYLEKRRKLQAIKRMNQNK